MRTFITGITAAVAMLFAVSVNAATVSVLWTEVNGSTIAPTANISVLPGDTMTATLYLDGTADGGIGNYSFSAQWDGGAVASLGGVSAVELLPAGFTANATIGLGGLTDSGAGSVGEALGYEALCFFCSVNGNFAVGTVSFTALAAGATSVQSGAFWAGVDDIINAAGTTITGSTTWGSADVNVIPEPATAGLLAIGLLGLGFAGRRRS